jgi:hypothetical protein
VGGSEKDEDGSDPPKAVIKVTDDEPVTRRDMGRVAEGGYPPDVVEGDGSSGLVRGHDYEDQLRGRPRLTERHDPHHEPPPSSIAAHVDRKTKHWASAITNVHKIIIGIAGICTMIGFGIRWSVHEIKDALRQNADALAERIDPAVMRPSKEEEDRRKKTGEPMPPTLTEQLSEIKKIQKTQLVDEGRISKLEDHDAANVNGEVGQRLDKVDSQLHVVFGNKKPLPVSPVGPTARQQGQQ